MERGDGQEEEASSSFLLSGDDHPGVAARVTVHGGGCGCGCGGVPEVVTVRDHRNDPRNSGSSTQPEDISNLGDDDAVDVDVDEEGDGNDGPVRESPASTKSSDDEGGTKDGEGDGGWEMDLDSYQILSVGVPVMMMMMMPPPRAGHPASSSPDEGSGHDRPSRWWDESGAAGKGSRSQPEGEDGVEDASLSSSTATVKETLQFVFTCHRGVSMLFWVGAVGAALRGLVFPGLAYVLSHSFSHLSNAHANGLESVNRVAYSFVAVGGFALLAGLAENWSFELVAYHASQNYRKQYVGALLRQDHAFFDVYDVSGIASQVEVNANRYRRGIGRKFAEGIEYTVAAVGGLVYAINSSWRVALVTLAFVPLLLWTSRFVMRLNEARGSTTEKSYQRAGGIAYAAVSSVRTVLSSNGVRPMANAYADATLEAFRESANFVLKLGFATGSILGSFLFLYGVLTMYGTSLLYEAVRGDGCDPSGGVPGAQACANTGTSVFGALLGIGFTARGLSQVSSVLEVFSQARVAAHEALVAMRRLPGSPRRVLFKEVADSDDNDGTDTSSASRWPNDIETGDEREIKAILPAFCIDSASPGGLRPEIRGRVSFQSVGFHYPTRPSEAALVGLSFEVEEGETVALVGPSGGGKSSVVMLLERLYDPTSGRILLDGVDLKDFNVHHLRSSMGYVGQEPVLFTTTIRENILFGKPNASFEEIVEAARLAHAHEFIMSLPDGYGTQVGHAGSMISVGQKQRICLARVLIGDHKLLLLDEATSALDAESELMVQDALDNVLQKKRISTIVVAHRLSTIRNASKILVIVNGRVEEAGSHDDLMASSTYYKRLVEKQEGSDDPDDASSSRVPPKVPLLDRRTPEGSDLPDCTSLNVPHVQFKNVSFSYPSRPSKKVLKDFNLTILRGETVALVGPSGGGKSTTASLIERFYDVSSGELRYCGWDVRSLNVGWYRKQLSFVEQEPTLFNMTIAENISFGMESVSRADIEAAAKQANAHDFIAEFPDGYETLVGTTKSSTGLSGGQKQRIAIARALVRKPHVLILDEATSALDNESEATVQQAIHKLMHSREHTVVVIAHRLSTIRNADRIALVSDGMVLEFGSHEELMSVPNGRYKRLFDSSKRRSTVDSIGLKRIPESADARNDEADEIDWEEKILIDETKAFNASWARRMALPDAGYILVGAVGALLAGGVFPMWGIVYSQTIGLLFTPVFPCPESGGSVPSPYISCEDYWDGTADSMRRRSFIVAGYWGALVVACILGNVLQFYGFGMASEGLNKRIRDMSFLALLRQEVTYFDIRGVGRILSQLQDDAAQIHAFSGEPVRTVITALASVMIGVVIAFAYMWPFALVALACVPIISYSTSARMKSLLGENAQKRGGDPDERNSPTGTVMETLLNMRTVSALVLEAKRFQKYEEALKREEPHYRMDSFTSGASAALALALVPLVNALLFWFGGWLMIYKGYSFNDFLVANFGIFYSLLGLGSAFTGISDRAQVKKSAGRVQYLLDRKSEIDPLSDVGKVLEEEK